MEMEAMTKSKFISGEPAPANAMQMSMGVFKFGDNGENTKSAPITMTARSGQPIEHWYWGKVVHDLAGMKIHKERLAIDYCHDTDQIIGYLNNFDYSSGDLVASGALTPTQYSTRASEIIELQKQGVPYEASINFGGDGIKMEYIEENEAAEVNGYKLDGPAVVIREWPLRGVAVCPYGADMNTESDFADNNKTYKYEVLNMANKATETETVKEELSAEVVEPKVEETVEDSTIEEVVIETELDNSIVDTGPGFAADDLLKYIGTFGAEKGAEMLLAGVNFEEAQTKHIKSLDAQIVELSAKVASAKSDIGMDEGVSFSEAQESKEEKKGLINFK